MLTYAWFLILCCYLDDPQLFLFVFESSSRVSCLSWTAKLLAVVRKSFRSQKWFGFPASFVYLNPFLQDCMILRSICSHWGELRDSYATITRGSNRHWCSRRKNHALRARGVSFWTERLPCFDNIYIDRKTQNCWHFCRFIKKEKLKYHMVLSIQTLCCDTHIFNSGAVHFFWSSLRWFYTFIWVQLCLIILIGLD